MVPRLEFGSLQADVRALLLERHEQWQSTVPWYRRVPSPVEEVPLYLALERLIRELWALVSVERDRARLAELRAERAEAALALLRERGG